MRVASMSRYTIGTNLIGFLSKFDGKKNSFKKGYSNSWLNADCVKKLKTITNIAYTKS